MVAPAGIVGAEPTPPGQQMTYSVTVHGRLSSVQEYENIVLRTGANGAIVRLRDVARIELAATDYARSSRLEGQPVAVLGVYQLPDANALEVAKQVRATLRAAPGRFPAGIPTPIRSTRRSSCPNRSGKSRSRCSSPRRWCCWSCSCF